MKLCIARILVTLAGLAGAAGAAAQTVLYKSVGPDGRTVYGDRPPADGRTAQTMKMVNLPSSPPSAATLAFLDQLRSGGASPAAAPASAELVLYTAAWCGYCKTAKAYLAGQGASYKEIDIESKAGAISFAQAGGQRSVPLLVKNGQRVQGFSAAAYDQLLRADKPR